MPRRRIGYVIFFFFALFARSNVNVLHSNKKKLVKLLTDRYSQRTSHVNQIFADVLVFQRPAIVH